MKKIILITTIFLYFYSFETKAQIIASMTDVTVNGTAINNCSTIAFGSNNTVSLSLKLRVTKLSADNVGNFANFKLYIKKNASSSPEFINGLIVNNSAFTNGGTTWEGTFSQTLQASSIDATGSVFFGIYEVSPTLMPQTCNYPLTKTSPTFSISPTSTYVFCNDLTARTFTVIPANIPVGSTLTYLWSFSGWYGNSTTSSISLTPISGTNLPSGVSVTPILNGIAQQQLNCPITWSTFLSSSNITGIQSICSGSATYSISGVLADQSVFWSLSNPLIATLSNLSTSSATVTFNSNGAQTLSATITNPCGQTIVKTFVINTGLPTFTTTATLTGSTASACSGSRVFTVNNLPAGQNVAWSVSDTDVATLSGTSNSQATINFVGSGSVILYATITNSCGQSSLRTLSLYSGFPTLTSFTCGYQSRPFCTGIVEATTFSIPSLNTTDRITATFSGMTTTESNTAANWEWRPLNNKVSLSGSKNNRLVGSIYFGTTGLEVRAKNACGWSQWFPLNWELVEIPEPLQRVSVLKDTEISVFPNPSNSSWNFLSENAVIQNIELFDVLGKNIYSEFYSDNQAVINCDSFKKGFYFAKVKTTLGDETFKLIKE